MVARSLRFRGFSGFLMVLMVWNVIPARQSIRGLRQLSPTKLTSVSARQSAWVFSDENGQRIVQTDNESYESTTTGHLWDETNPSTPCWICSISADAWTGQQKPRWPFSLRRPTVHLHPPPNPTPSPQPCINTPRPVSNCLLSLRHSYLQAPGCHCWDDILNAKWYGI